MMVKGTVQKVESLADGSIKLSVYGKMEDFAAAAGLNMKAVVVQDSQVPVPFEAARQATVNKLDAVAQALKVILEELKTKEEVDNG